MEPAFDSLGAYRKLEESGMPEPQAGATVEVVKDAMQNLVTKEYLTAELDQRFGAVDKQFSGVDQQFREVDKQFAAVDKQFNEVEKRLTELKSDMDRGFAEMGRRQAWGFVYMSVFFIGLATFFLTAQQRVDGRAPAGQPAHSIEPGPAPATSGSRTTGPANEPPPAMAQ